MNELSQCKDTIFFWCVVHKTVKSCLRAPTPKPPGWAGRNAPPPPPRSAGYIGERSETEDARAEWRGWRRGWGAAVALYYRETAGAE